MIEERQKKKYLTVKDHSVSGEFFDLLHNADLDMLETVPRPSSENLPNYYKSEDYISHTDSKRNFFEKAYHLVRSFSLNQKLKLINSLNEKKGTLLDIGCGTGEFLNVCNNNGWDILGIEPDEGARAIANNKVGNSVFSSNELNELKKESFDIITLWHVLEHLPNLEADLAIFKKLLKPEGVLIIAVPNFKSYDANYYKEFWAAFDVPRHLWHFSRTAISKLVSKKDMVVVKIKPMWFDAFYVSLLSEKHKNGKMNIFRAFWVAARSNVKALSTKEASSLIYIIKKQKN